MRMYSEMGGGDDKGGDASGRRRFRRPLLFALLGALLETLPLWLRGYGLGGKVVVRCREGHLFTTIWIPGASVKALRFGFWRFQRCPVGKHWSIVAPVKRSALTRREQRFASQHEDIRVP
jgi:hypothetical protein